MLCWRSFDNPSNRIIRAARDQGLGGQLLTSLRRLSHSEEGIATIISTTFHFGVRRKKVCPVTNLVASLNKYLTRPTISSF
jgi:hypothetical protein